MVSFKMKNSENSLKNNLTRSDKVKPSPSVSRWRDFFEIVILVFVIALFVRAFLLGIYRISNDTMAPALRLGDFIWTSKISYGVKIPLLNQRFFHRLPDKGDVVIVELTSGQQLKKKIMRVLAHPGDHVEQKAGALWVNGESVMPFVVNVSSLVVPPGDVFLILQNPEPLTPQELITSTETSENTRSSSEGAWALISTENVEEQVKGIWFSLGWSWNTNGDPTEAHPRWDRIGGLSSVQAK